MAQAHLPFEIPDFIANPYPYYEELREQAPIFWDEERQAWLFLNYQDINSLLRDPRLGRSISPEREQATRQAEPAPGTEAVRRYHRDILMDKEPPEHTRLKQLVQQVFTPRRVEGLRGRIRDLAQGLLNDLTGETRFDLLAGYAEPLPVLVIAELLGVPRSDWRSLRRWSNSIVRVYELNHTPGDERAASLACEEFFSYLRRLVDLKKSSPEDDLLSSLVRLREEGGQLSEQELLSTCILLLNAGHEATVNVLGNGMLALLQSPAQLALLRERPELGKGAVEEMLRYDTPLQYFHRWVLKDLEFAGQSFRRGERLGFLYGAGNRDPARFASPQSFDIQRVNNAHLSFGGGIHYCLGAPLARLELFETLQVLLKRYPKIELGEGPIEFRQSFVIRGLIALPICVTE